MTNTPICRIPLEDMTEMQLLNSELNASSTTIADALADLAEFDAEADSPHLSITLDWAMQLRDRTGQDWGWCLKVAQIAYYG